MRKSLSKMFILVSTLFVLTNCKKLGKTYDGYFYTDIENPSGPLYLYVDDAYKGELPNLKTRLAPNNDTLLNQALHLSLKSGRYKIVGKDAQGSVKSSGTLKFRSYSTSGSSTIGGQATSINEHTFAHKVYY
ncbi:MAG: hypothetical protein H0W73_10830 [Bacteroidetes bacterium]|nr:hypothetical protein [Bacteroidota bacterium]